MPQGSPLRTWCTALFALVSFFSIAGSASAADVQLIVGRDPGLSAPERTAVRADAGVRFKRQLRITDTELVAVPAAEADAALQDLNADPDVRYAMRDGKVSKRASTTADPRFGALWGLQNAGQTIRGVAGVAGADMHVPAAWNAATGLGVTVAVVDTGVDFTHQDLRGRLAINPRETGLDSEGRDRATNGVDDDHDGLVDNWRGWDYVANDNLPADGDGHGTHVTGTIAAANGNGLGITGVAPDARVLPLRVLDDNGFGRWSAVAEAFDAAGAMGVRVVNASLGGDGPVPVLTDVMNKHPDTLYIVAAGNDTLNLDAAGIEDYPCESPAVNVVCVGATDGSDKSAKFSNFGATAVDLFAPGVNILSTLPGDRYGYYSGTSMATPHIAGEAALVLSRDSGLSGQQLKDALLSTTDPKPAIAGLALNGRANAEAAVGSVPADRDGDGVLDAGDACADTAGTLADGCPDPATDGDLDGVAQAMDDCPAQAGLTANAGCPAPDRDGDALPDASDACPADAGSLSYSGCPAPLDRDGDGVPDTEDQCPTVAGDAAYNGCPAPAQQPAAPGLVPPVTADPTPTPAPTPGPVPADPPAGPVPGNPITTPPGADRDGDGVLDPADQCPDVPGPARNAGCPWPAAQLTARLAFTGRASRTLTVSTVRPTTVRVVVQRRVCVRRTCSYRTVGIRALSVRAGARRTVALRRLARGAYRLQITAGASDATPARRTLRFTVR
jgi:subtilisin family serine protease